MECQADFFSILRTMQFSDGGMGDNLRQIVYAMVDRIPLLPAQLKKQVDTWYADLLTITGLC
jgi:hypothetical protein